MVTVAKRKKKASSFGRRLRELREAAGLTQTELATRAGMLYQALAKYERGAVEPTWPSVVAIAEALSVTPDSFLDNDKNPPPAPSQTRRPGKPK